jgi:hypothetical protein
MAAEESEPDITSLPRISKKAAKRLGAESVYRAMAIEGEQVIPEPYQPGVHRYPPVRVQLPRNSKAVKDYINMGPTPVKPPNKPTG